MKRSQWWAVILVTVLCTGTASGCTILRTPYEKQKIAENGGQVKKKNEGQGSDQSSGGENKKESGGKGGGGAEVKQKQKERVESESTKKRNEQLSALQEKTEDQNPHLLYSKTLSSQVSQLEGVEGGTVLFDEEHNAYVAIYSGDKPKRSGEMPKGSNDLLRVKTEGNIPAKLQEQIAKKLRVLDPLVGTVYLTDNPEHAQSFQRYANQIAKGGAGTMNTQALAEHIQDIWK